MTRRDAMEEIAEYTAKGPTDRVVVRWAWRFGPPCWTIEARWWAEQEIQEYGGSYARIESP